MIKNYDESVKINHNPNWPHIPDHPYRILIIASSGSGKTNVLLNLTLLHSWGLLMTVFAKSALDTPFLKILHQF